MDRAEKENWPYRDFLALLLAEESGAPQANPPAALHPTGSLSVLQTIDEFDFTLQSTLRQSLLGSYLGPDFVTDAAP